MMLFLGLTRFVGAQHYTQVDYTYCYRYLISLYDLPQKLWLPWQRKTKNPTTRYKNYKRPWKCNLYQWGYESQYTECDVYQRLSGEYSFCDPQKKMLNNYCNCQPDDEQCMEDCFCQWKGLSRLYHNLKKYLNLGLISQDEYDAELSKLLFMFTLVSCT